MLNMMIKDEKETKSEIEGKDRVLKLIAKLVYEMNKIYNYLSYENADEGIRVYGREAV